MLKQTPQVGGLLSAIASPTPKPKEKEAIRLQTLISNQIPDPPRLLLVELPSILPGRREGAVKTPKRSV